MSCLPTIRKYGPVIGIFLLCLCGPGLARGNAEDPARVQLTTEEKQWLASHPEITIGLRETPPLTMKGEREGAFFGLSIDYIHLLEQRLGVRFKLVYYPTWRELLEKARKKEVDVLVTAVWTPERSGWLNYTRPYIILANKIIVRRGTLSEIDSLEKLQDKKIGVLDGSALHDYLKRYQGVLTIVPMRDESLALTDVSLGAVDAVVMDIARASYYSRKDNIVNLVSIGAVGYNYEYGFSSRKDWPLLIGILEKGLASLSPEERESIFRKWVAPLSTSGSLLTNKNFWLSVAGTGIAVFTVMVLLWNRALRRRVTQSTAELSSANTQLQQKHRTASILFTLSEVISRSIHRNRLLEDVLKNLSELEILPIAKSGIFTIERERLQLAAHAGYSDDALRFYKEMKVTDRHLGAALTTGEIIIAEPPPQASSNTPASPERTHYTDLLVPLKTKDRVEGMLVLSIPVGSEPAEDTVKMLATIGNQLGIAIENARLYEKTKERSLLDSLTGLWNHEEIMRILEQELDRAKREGASVGVIMIDLDHFKRVNDTYGHLTGDAVLRKIAEKLRSSLRSYENVGRYGGEEFLLVVPGCDLRIAGEIAERIRKKVVAEVIDTQAGEIAVTISLGVAVSSPERQSTVPSLVHAADLALYRAKKNGRNRMELALHDETGASNT